MIQDVSIVILAGGKSSRMGRDKGLLSWGSHSFIDHLVEQFERTTKEIWISVAAHNCKSYEKYQSILIQDQYEGLGPLGGINSVLSHIKTNWFYVISVDAPLITSHMLEDLWNSKNGFEAVVFETEGKIHPLIGLYHMNTGKVWKSALVENKLKITNLVCQMNYKSILANKDQMNQLKNINTPKDYKEVLKS